MIKKRKKFALSLKVLSLLSCIAVLSVGFASWIIIQQPAQQDKAGSITTYTTAEAGMTLTTQWMTITEPETQPRIIFGRPSTIGTGNAIWLTSKKSDGVNYDVEPQVLVALLKVTYTLDQVDLDNITFTLAAAQATFADLVSGGLLAAPTLQAFKDDACAQSISDSVAYNNPLVINDTNVDDLEPVGNVYTFYVKVAFGWGEKLGGLNPYTYYNLFKVTDVAGKVVEYQEEDYTLNAYGNATTTAGQFAKAALDDINAKAGTSFSLTINGTAAAQQFANLII